MRARKHIIIFCIGVLLGGLLLGGCKPEEPTQQLAMPISICLPAGDVYASQAPGQRAFGDPGTTEQFALPKFIYIYILKYIGSGEVGKSTLTNWKVWDIISEEPTASEWEMTHYVGEYETGGDSIFRYKTELKLMMTSGSFDGRIYIYASAVPLTLSTTITTDSTLANLLNLRFSFSGSSSSQNEPTSVVNNLQNIYSTPYNYTNNQGDYYGSFYATQKVPHLNLLLYHVASKVDLMWNVAEEKRDSVKISYVAATNLYDGPCYVFRPTENIIAAAAYGSGYTKMLLNEESPCPGTQWNGRKYFYAIPYRNNNSPTGDYPLQIRMLKNGDNSANPEGATSYYGKVVNTTVPNVWTSWIRGQITINKGKYNVGG